MSRERFNERYRDDYNKAKEYVKFVAKNNEVKGEKCEPWTKPFPGIPAEFWQIPVGIPVWGPKYLRDRLQKCGYHIMKMDQSTMNNTDGMGQYYGSMVVDDYINRIDAEEVSENRRVFMGARIY